MFYLIKNGKVSDVDTNTFSDDNMPKNQQFLGVMCYDEIFSTADSIGLDYNQGVFDNRTPRFENHDGFDFVCINLINKQDLFEKSNAVYIHLKKDMLLFICEEPKIMEDILEKIIADNPNDLNISKLLCAVFDKITDDDTAVLQDIELELTLLEDALIELEKRTCVAEIISIRKRLMCLKVYYQQLLDIFDGICANENELIDNHIMRQFKIVANRLSRLFTSVNDLKEYTAHVRNSYQEQVNINLNLTMKLFTVISAIFLPLSLIVGWYGMNFTMPEFGWKFGYLGVILLSITIIGVTIALFKKNKWF